MGSKFFSFLSGSSKTPLSLDQLAAYLQLFPTAVWLVDEKGKILFVNQRVHQLPGFQTQSLPGTNISAYGLTLEDIARLTTMGGSAKITKEMVSAELKSVYLSIGANRIPNSPYFLITLEALPDYQKLISEKQFFQSIVASYPHAVTVQDEQGICQAWNKQAEQLFGRPASAVVGNKLAEALPAELLGALEILDKELMAGQPTGTARQMTFKRSSGAELTLSVRKVPVQLDKNTEIPAILTIFEDITVQKAEETQFWQTRNLLQAILDNVPLGIYTRTIEGKMTYYNKQSQVVLGQFDPHYVNEPYPGQDPAAVREYAVREKAIIDEGKVKEYPAEEYVDHQGNKKIIRLIKIPLKQAGPEPMVLSIVEDVTKRYEQEQRLVTANAFLSAIVENMPVGLYARTRAGKLLLSNKRSEEIFHDQMAQLDEYGNSSHETEEQAEGYLQREAQILESGQILDIPEEPYTTADGHKSILHLVKVPVLKKDGSFNFVITMVEDITDRKMKEKQLDEALRFQQAILENAPVAIYAYDTNNQVRFFNKMAEQVFPGECDRRREGEQYNKRDKELFDSGKVMDIPEEEYFDERGEKRKLHLIKSPLFDKDGNPFMVLNIGEDITLKKNQEKEILRSKNFLQSIVDNLPVALSVKRPDGTYILWNKRSEDIFGVCAGEVIGQKDYRSNITREQLEFVLESDQKVFAGKKELNIAQELISTPAQGVKIMHTVKTPLFTEAGEPEYLLNVSEDITGKTKMEKQIREASEKNSLLVENSREGILILEDRKIIYSNRAAYQILGFKSAEELAGRKLSEFITPDYQLSAKEKYDAVISGVQGAEKPLQISLRTPDQRVIDAEICALVSKYMGRRIVIVFLRDNTSINKATREMKKERELFKNVFERYPEAAFILNYKGYISLMNEAARHLFHFTEQDAVFYRNVYVRPALRLEVRKALSKGEYAQMRYQFDFARAAAKFPGRIRGEGVLDLQLTLLPLNRRDTKEGQVQSDYLVTIFPMEKQTPAGNDPLPTPAPQPVSAKTETQNENTPQTSSQEELEAILGAWNIHFMRTLENIDLAAVVLTPEGKIVYSNAAFGSTVGQATDSIKGKGFFASFVSQADSAKQLFYELASRASGNAFQVQLELEADQSRSSSSKWDVFLLKNTQGKLEGYGLIRTR